MPKRIRNELGRFATKCGDFQPFNLINALAKKTTTILFITFLFAIISPWIVLIIKSKRIRALINAILQFYDSHFLGIDEDGINSKEGNNGGYFSFK